MFTILKVRMKLAVALSLAACGSTKPTPAAPTDPPAPSELGTGSASVPATPPDVPEAPATPAAPPVAAAEPKAELLAAEAAAWENAKPVFTVSCAACHTTGGKKASKKKLDHFNFDSYPPGGHHTSTIGVTIRDVMGISGKKPTMPYDKPGSVKGDDLAKIQAWVDAWEAAERGGAHPGAGNHHH
ncbi:MAG: hypothetical protein JNL83_34620 [Myxococcales bacterium]|nr:hypothetical protein [Myxococcales bacterium]